MIYAGNISGNKPNAKKYNVNGGAECIAGAAIQTNHAADNTSGCIPQTNVVCVGCLGVAMANAVSIAAQNGADDNMQQVATIINPDAIWRTKMSGDAVEDTALLFCSAAQAADGTGLVITGAIDENLVWGYEGDNAGRGMLGARQASGAAALTTAMRYDIAALDTFLYTPINVGTWSQYPQMTAGLTQIDIDDGTIDNDNANFIAVDFILRDVSDDGRNNSYALLVAVDHAFGPSKI